MGAVLDVIGRPIALSSCVVPLVEQCVERFKHKRFVLLFNRLAHRHLRRCGYCCKLREVSALSASAPLSVNQGVYVGRTMDEMDAFLPTRFEEANHLYVLQPHSLHIERNL